MELTCQNWDYRLRIGYEKDNSNAEFQMIKHSCTIVCRFEKYHSCKKSDKQKQIYEKKSSITQITLPNYYYG